MTKQRIIYIFIMLLIVTWGCSHKFIDNTPTVSTNCSADTVYFQNEILPILNSNCAMSGCHNSSSHKEGVILDTYSNIINTGGVTKGNASNSDLYKVMISTGNKAMPPNGTLSSDITNKIKTWINQGAHNNACLSCDTSGEMKYSVQITAIMDSYCKGCHNTNNAGGGINLDNYTDVKTQVTNGNLLGSIEQSSGFSPMPQNQSKLEDCKINQIKKWINNGAPNN